LEASKPLFNTNKQPVIHKNQTQQIQILFMPQIIIETPQIFSTIDNYKIGQITK